MFKKIHFMVVALACVMNNNTFSTCVGDLPLIEKSSVSTSSTTTNHIDFPRPLRVLVLEGGAMRSIIQKVILYYLWVNTGKEPYQLFDLIVGSSAGVALAAQCTASTPEGKLRNSIKDIVFGHQRDGESMLFRSSLRNVRTCWGLIAPKYRTSLLLQMGEKHTGNCKLSQTLVPIVIPVIDALTGQIRVLSTRLAKENPDTEDFFLGEAGAAAISFPGLFGRIKMKSPIVRAGQSENYLIASDAGPIIYHPGTIALKEVREMLKRKKNNTTAKMEQISKVLSDFSLTEQERLSKLDTIQLWEHRIQMLDIGSGIPKKWVEPKVCDSSNEPKVPNTGLLQNIKPVWAQMFQGLGFNARDGVEAFFGDNEEQNYCRLQVLLTKEKDGTYPFVLDDINPKVTNALISQTIEYTETKEFRAAIQKFFGHELKTPLTPLKKEDFLIKTKPIKSML